MDLTLPETDVLFPEGPNAAPGFQKRLLADILCHRLVAHDQTCNAQHREAIGGDHLFEGAMAPARQRSSTVSTPFSKHRIL